MTFMQPGMLWGLLALAIPVLIHLFNFQRTERIVFANTRLLSEAVQKTKRARQLKNWFLLAMRMLALAFLITAFAQPVIRRAETNAIQGTTQMAVYVDNSASMVVVNENQSALDMALAYAKTIPQRFDRKGWYQLLTNQFDAGHVWTSANGFLDQCTEVATVSKSRDLQTVLNRLVRQFELQKLGENKTIALVSDFQKTAAGPLNSLRLDSTIHYSFTAIENTQTPNVFIDSVWLGRPISMGAKSQELKIRVGQSGSQVRKPVNVQLYANGNLISGKTIALTSSKTLDAVLPFRIKANELLCCSLTVDDAPNSFDNAFYFTLKAPPPVAVYIIDATGNNYLKHIFSNKDLFRTTTATGLNVDFQKLKEANCVVLNQVSGVDNALKEALLQRLGNGSSVVYIPGKTADAEPGLCKDAGFSVKPLPETDATKPADWKIVLPGKQDAFFSGAFSEILPSSTQPFARPTVTVAGGLPLLKYENGTSYLSVNNVQTGKLFVLAAPLLAESGNVQQHPLFVPIMYKMAFAGSNASALPLFFRNTESQVLLAADSVFQPAEKPLKLVNGKHETMVQAQKAGNAFRIEIPSETMNPGFWNAFVGDKKIGTIALNSPAAESEMDFYSAEELKQAFAGKPWVSVNTIGRSDSPEHLSQQTENGFPLWKYCIYLSLLMFAGEITTLALARKKGAVST